MGIVVLEKSSLINLVKEKFDKTCTTDQIKISEFNCLYLMNDETLETRLLNHLECQVADLNHYKKWKLFQRLIAWLTNEPIVSTVEKLASLGGILGVIGSSIFKLLSKITKKSLEGSNTKDKRFKKINAEIGKTLGKKYIMVIDDIDKLSSTQILSIFDSILTFGRIPNLFFLVAYDRKFVEKLIYGQLQIEGSQYLERIVQAGFEIPVFSLEGLKQIFLAQLNTISTKYDYQNDPYFKVILDELIFPNLLTMRDLKKLINSIKNYWEIVGDYVNTTDFLAIETLKLCQPNLISIMRTLKMYITENAPKNIDKEELENIFKKFKISETRYSNLVQDKIKFGTISAIS